MPSGERRSVVLAVALRSEKLWPILRHQRRASDHENDVQAEAKRRASNGSRHRHEWVSFGVASFIVLAGLATRYSLTNVAYTTWSTK